MKFRTMLFSVLLLALAPFAMATTQTLNMRAVGGDSPSPFMAAQTYTYSVTVDFSAQTTQTAGSVTQLFNIPAKAFVLGVKTDVLTAEGATCTAKIGDAADDDGYATAANLNSATSTFSFNATSSPAFGVGKYYAAAGVIKATHGHDTDKAVVKWSVTYILMP